MTSVLISVPNQAWIHKHVTFALLKLQLDRRFQVRIILPTHSPLENNLHRCVRDFLRHGEDFWLSIDSDNPPINNVLDLVYYDLDVVGFPTPVWHHTGEKKGERPIYWNMYKKDPNSDAYLEWPDKQGLQQPDALGGGCFLIARRVFENKELQKGAFFRTYDEFGRTDKGNDIAFSERAREQGFELWADYGYPCRHFVELELTEAIQAFRGLTDG